MNSFILRVLRGVRAKQYWEEFELERKPFMTVTAALMEVQKHPVTREGKGVTPVAWEQGCLEEVCGSCSMLVNGRPRQACSAMIETLVEESKSKTVELSPFTKFPLLRDLVVDRSSMFEALKEVKAWIEAEDSLDRGFGPRISPKVQEQLYTLSTCMTCGCCLEACPQVNDDSDFIGPAAISQVRLFNNHPVGKYSAGERLKPMMRKGGVADCGNAQNCARVCPKEIPLTESIAAVGRQTTKYALQEWNALSDQSKQ